MANQEMVRFNGNCPSNVNKDAKYTVKLEQGEYVVGIFYRSSDGELWYPTSGNHPELVEMVNKVKIHFSGSPGGAFYINEYNQVIVPVAGDENDYYLAGEYTKPLEFEFEGKIITGDAKDFEGNPLSPGDLWVGPHPGIPYILKAGGKDIYYKLRVRPKVEKVVSLSDYIGKEAENIALHIARIKSPTGGRFYINEFRQVFAPRYGDHGLEYIYICKINDLSKWFPKPHAI
ncbi:MAG TPA: hypothetical protein GX693_05320 [Firmicutes bacterium]|nr:hypothetical protein [Bacillota bacterium]